MDWEGLAIRSLDSLVQGGIQFGAAYGNQWLGSNALEQQLELVQRFRPQIAPAPANATLLLLLIVGAVILAKKG